MTPTPRTTDRPCDLAPPPAPSGTQQSDGPLAQVARLAALRDEASETAELANLLGRTPYLAAGLAFAAGLVAATATVEPAPLVTWLVLVCAGIVALIRAYRHSIAAPFELASLRSFAGDLTAIVLYVGFAWGAGSFLALPPNGGFLQALAFSAAPSLLVALAVRLRNTTAGFVVPVCILASLAAVAQPAGAGVLGAGLVVAAGLVAIGLAHLVERLTRRVHNPQLEAILSL